MTCSWLPICFMQRKLEKYFEVLDMQYIPRTENAMSDDLSTKASTSAPVPDAVLERRLR
jgi:hypothetical protein